MNQTAKNFPWAGLASWAITFWTCYVFLFSLPYKFTNHPDTQHIFGTIGAWMQGILGAAIGGWFADFGAYVVGSFELLTSIVLLLPGLLWIIARLLGLSVSDAWARARFHRAGGLMAAAVMGGAVFFHLFTPLGVEVLHQGQSDGGSLFYAAVSILLLGLVMYAINALGEG